MATARGFANHAIYMARILLDTWESTIRSEKEFSPDVVNAAFAPAVRLHLIDAYGWFLLDAIKAARLPDHPPHGVADLPKQQKGLPVAELIEDFARLERSGWLADLLSPVPAGLPPERQGMIVGGSLPGLREFTAWRDSLLSLFGDVSEIAQEY